MALDPSIILGVRPAADPMESMGRAMSLRQLAQQGQMQQMQMEQAQREQQDQQTLADLYRGAIGADGKLDRTALLSGAASRGLGAKIPGLQKQLLEADKTGADLEKVRAETSGLNYKQLQQRVEATNGALTSLLSRPQVTHQDVLGAMQALVQQGLAKPEEMQAALQQIPQDPAQLRPYLEQKRLEGLTAAERLKALTPDLQMVNDGQTTRFLDKNPITNPGGPAPVQMRMTPGEVATNSVARERLAEDRRHNGVTEGQAGQAVTYQQAADGSIVALPARLAPGKAPAGVPVMGADGKPLQGKGTTTEDQAKAAGWLAQASNAWQNMQTVLQANPGAAKAGILPPGSKLDNVFGGADRQRFNQAASSLSEALLRAATGAGINAYEADQKVRELTPQLGDTPEVIKQKLDSVPMYLKTLELRAGPAARGLDLGGAKPAPAQPAPAAPKAPRVGATEDGWLFTGGDPADPKSWKKVR